MSGRETYVQAFQSDVAPDEHLVIEGLAVHVDYAERHGRGTGEGRLFLTDQAIWHWRNGLSAPDFREPLSRFPEVKDSWIIMPGMRELKLFIRIDGALPLFSFYTGKRLARAASAYINTSRES